MSNLKPQSIAAQPEKLGSTNRGYDNAVTEKDAPEILVTLEKINEIIMGYLSNVINPSVEEGGVMQRVPVIYGTPERWATVREKGFLRDETNKLLTPLIMLHRTSVKKGVLANPNNKYLHTTLTTGWNRRNAYDRFAVLNNIRPSQQLHQVMIPDYMDLQYEGLIWTNLLSQMDKVIEQINVENDEFWGERNNFKFRVSIDAFDSQNELPADETRVIRTGFQMKVAAYLLPERMVKNMKLASTSQPSYTAKKVVTFTEAVNDIEKI